MIIATTTMLPSLRKAFEAQLVASGWKRLAGNPCEFFWPTSEMARA